MEVQTALQKVLVSPEASHSCRKSPEGKSPRRTSRDTASWPMFVHWMLTGKPKPAIWDQWNSDLWRFKELSKQCLCHRKPPPAAEKIRKENRPEEPAVTQLLGPCLCIGCQLGNPSQPFGTSGTLIFGGSNSSPNSACVTGSLPQLQKRGRRIAQKNLL